MKQYLSDKAAKFCGVEPGYHDVGPRAFDAPIVKRRKRADCHLLEWREFTALGHRIFRAQDWTGIDDWSYTIMEVRSVWCLTRVENRQARSIGFFVAANEAMDAAQRDHEALRAV